MRLLKIKFARTPVVFAAIFVVFSIVLSLAAPKLQIAFTGGSGPYRWRNDNGSETAATFAAAEGAPLTVGKNTPMRLRVAAGNDGSTSELLQKGYVALPGGFSPGSGAVDSANGYAYFVNNNSTVSVVKINLNGTNNNPILVGQITLPSTNIDAYGMVLDPVHGYLYVASYDQNASFQMRYSVVAKVALGSGNNLPSYVGETTIPQSIGELGGGRGIIDPANGVAYFGNFNATPTAIAEITLGSGSSLPSYSGAYTFPSSIKNIESSVIDITHGYAYFTTNDWQGGTAPYFIKMNVSGGGLSLVNYFQMPSDDNNLAAMAVDPVNGYVYLANPGPIRMEQVAMNGSGSASRVGGTSFSMPGNGDILSLVVDQNNGLMYAVKDTSPGSEVAKFAIGAGTPSSLGYVTLGNESSTSFYAAIDAANGYLYLTGLGPSDIVKVSITPKASYRLEYGLKTTANCSDISSWTQVPSAATSEDWQMAASANVSDGQATTHLAGLTDPNTSFTPGQVKTTSSQASQISLGESQFTQMEYSVEATNNATSGNNYCFRLTDAGTVTPLTGTTYPEATVITSGSYAWRHDDGSETSATFAAAPGTPVSLAKNTPIRLRVAAGNDGTVSDLSANTMRVTNASGNGNYQQEGDLAVDDINHYAYYVANPNFGSGARTRIVKFSLGAGNSNPTELGALSLDSSVPGGDILIDPGRGYGYLYDSFNSQIIKIRLGAGNALPTVVATLPVSFTSNNFKLDRVTGYLYMVEFGFPEQIVKIDPGAGDNAPSIASSGNLAADDASYFYQMYLDSVNGYGYLVESAPDSKILKFSLGSGATAPARIGVLDLPGDPNVEDGALDVASGYGYFIEHDSPNPAAILKIALGVGAALPTRVGTTAMLTDEGRATSPLLGTLDLVNGFYYYIAAPSSTYANGHIAKIAPGAGAALPTLVTVTALNSSQSVAVSESFNIGLDATVGNLYYATTIGGTQTSLIRVSITPKAAFRLEYGLKSSTCAAIASWTQVPATATSQAWQMVASANVNDGDPTTALTGIIDPSVTFVAGQVKTTGSDATSVAFGQSESTQMEYSVEATDNAADGANYCFRLTNAGTPTALSTTYPEALIATSGPNAPTLSTPADNTYTSDGNVYFSWSAVTGATSYTLDVPGAFTQTIGTNSWTQVAMNTGTYTWTVTAHGPGGDSAASAPFTFTLMAPPTPASPADNFATSSTAQTIAWSTVTGATSYHVYVTEQAGVFGGVLNTTTTDTHVDLTGLNPGHLYTWNITTVDALSVQSNYSTDSSFTILGAPGISYPPDGTYMSNRSPSLTWIGFTGATGYHIFVTSNGGSTGDILDETTAATTVDLFNLATGAYEWHVTSIDGLGHETAASASTTFTILAPPTLSAPTNGATLTDAAPTLSWNAVTGATEYHLVVSTQGGSTGDTFNGNSVNPSVDLVGLANDTYDWYVTTVDAGANQTAPSATRSFTINVPSGGTPPATPTQTAPTSGYITASGGINFTWNAVSPVDHYNVYSPGVMSVGTTGTSWLQNSIPPGAYTWHVEAVNSLGTPSDPSPSWSYTVLAPPTLSAPANASTSGNTAPTLSWTAVPNATAYHIFVTTHGGAPGAVHSETTAATSVQLSGLANGTYDWNVATVDGASIETNPSATRTFTVLVSSGSVGGSSPSGNPTATPPTTTGGGNTNTNKPPASPVEVGTTDAIFHFTNPGNATTFKLYDAPPNSSPHLVATENDPNATSITETGLKPNTTYGDRVISAVAYGTESAPSPPFPSFTTLLPLPDSITPVYDPNTQTVSFTVTGTFPNLTVGQSGLDFVIKTKDGKSLFDSGFVKTPGTGALSSVDFEPGESYVVVVTTRNITGDLNGPKDYPISIPAANFGAAKIILTKTADKTDMAVTNTRTKVTTQVTKEIKYSVTAANTGAGIAKSFVLTDPLPTGLNFQIGSLTVVTDLDDPDDVIDAKYDPETKTITASIRELEPHESFVISFVATPVSGTIGSIKNKASASWEE